jgi:hypothetical protein
MCQGIAFSHQAAVSDQFLARLAKALKLDLRAVIAAEYFKYSGDADTNRFISGAVCTAKRTCLHVSSEMQRDYFLEINDTTQEQILFLGFVWHPREYQLYYSWLAQGKRASVHSLARLLHLNLEPLLIDSFRRTSIYSDSSEARSFLRDAVITYQLLNFSGDSLHPNDYLVQLNKPNIKYSQDLTVAFVKLRGKYHLAFEYYFAGKDGGEPTLLDIDSDGRSEILIVADEAGNQSTRETVTIWRYRQPRFQIIFREGLNEAYGFFPYNYENKYCFKPNRANTRLLDIDFRINTSIDFYTSEAEKLYGSQVQGLRPVTDSVTFTFNGVKYVPHKRFYDYRKVFRRYFPEERF